MENPAYDTATVALEGASAHLSFPELAEALPVSVFPMDIDVASPASEEIERQFNRINHHNVITPEIGRRTHPETQLFLGFKFSSNPKRIRA